MSAVCVIGIPRSGTSLTAGLCQALGVNMGNNLISPAGDNPRGFFEDWDFCRFNEGILLNAGGYWLRPPSHEAINESGQRLRPQIEKLVAQKQVGLWGWKDPRNCLTAHLYHPLLDDPKYVVVRRDQSDVVASLSKRHTWIGGAVLPDSTWIRLYLTYWSRAMDFIRSVDREQVLHLVYELLTHPQAARAQVDKLAAFLGVDDESAVEAAMGRIAYRERGGGVSRVPIM